MSAKFQLIVFDRSLSIYRNIFIYVFPLLWTRTPILSYTYIHLYTVSNAVWQIPLDWKFALLCLLEDPSDNLHIQEDRARHPLNTIFLQKTIAYIRNGVTPHIGVIRVQREAKATRSGSQVKQRDRDKDRGDDDGGGGLESSIVRPCALYDERRSIHLRLDGASRSILPQLLRAPFTPRDICALPLLASPMGNPIVCLVISFVP